MSHLAPWGRVCRATTLTAVFFGVAATAEDGMMRLGTGLAAVVALAWSAAALPAHGQQIGQQPLGPAATAPTDGKQIVQLHEAPDTRLTAQDCAGMPTPVEITDCLNRISEGGQYMPTPKPAPGTDLPMTYRLPLGQRQLDAQP